MALCYAENLKLKESKKMAESGGHSDFPDSPFFQWKQDYKFPK